MPEPTDQDGWEPSADYVTTDAYADVRKMLTRFMRKTVLFVKNVGANGGRYRVWGSVDKGATFDVPEVNATVIAAGALDTIIITNAYDDIKIEAQSQVGGNPTTLRTKAYKLR